MVVRERGRERRRERLYSGLLFERFFAFKVVFARQLRLFASLNVIAEEDY